MRLSRLLRPALPARYSFVILALLSVLAAAFATLYSVRYTNSTVSQLRQQQLAGCAFAADIGMVPLPSVPKPSKLGVSLVSDARHQWRALHCPGSLPEPPGLARWAAYYRLPGS